MLQFLYLLIWTNWCLKEKYSLKLRQESRNRAGECRKLGGVESRPYSSLQQHGPPSRWATPLYWCQINFKLLKHSIHGVVKWLETLKRSIIVLKTQISLVSWYKIRDKHWKKWNKLTGKENTDVQVGQNLTILQSLKNDERQQKDSINILISNQTDDRINIYFFLRLE